jgi:hypothetical protein
LAVTATGGGVVMAMRHRELPAYGVQFHPSRSSRRTASGCWRRSCAQPRPDGGDRPARIRGGPRRGRRGRRPGRDHGRQRLGGADRRGADRAAHQGRDGGGDRRPGAHHAPAGHARGDWPRRPRRHRGHRRRAADLQTSPPRPR